MRRNRVLVLLGLMGLAGLVTGCDPSVRTYLGKNGGDKGLYKWESYVNEHLCLLEKYSTVPDVEKKCPTVPPSVTPPPAYPPK